VKIVMTSVKGPFESDASDDDFVEELRAAYPDIDFLTPKGQEERKRDIRYADVFFGWPSRDLYLAAERLRWIHCPGTGIDQLAKVQEFMSSDVVLTNARGPHAAPMADHVMGMVVNLAHRWRDIFEDQSAHRWDTYKYHDSFVTLAGSTMGILALGDIGIETARRASGFGMKVYAVDINPRSAPREVEQVWGLERLDDLLKMSDWFVVTAPLTPHTRGLIDRRRIGLMKEGAYLIVISRGQIVDEDALVEALRAGRLAGAGIDAFAQEPLDDDSPLWDMRNVIVTPHNSAETPEMTQGRRQIFRENLKRFLADEPFLYVVNKKAGF
jgi:phosphoglycerate dehydrogenase-like enzyme